MMQLRGLLSGFVTHTTCPRAVQTLLANGRKMQRVRFTALLLCFMRFAGISYHCTRQCALPPKPATFLHHLP
jgi:hypothetical protein